MNRKRMGWIGAALVLLVLAFNLGTMLWFDRYPPFSPELDPKQERVHPVGVAYVDALLYIYEEGLNPWLPNDRVAATVFLDNKPNHQLGQLEGLRTGVFVLRESLARMRAEDRVDEDVEEAFNRFAIDPEAWFLPSAEEEYAAGAEALRRYRARLIAGEARFYPRPDNLAELLYRYRSVVGSANMGLYSSIGSFQNWIDQKEDEGRLTAEESIAKVRVDRFEVDDHFYFSKGLAFAFREILNAAVVDFDSVLTQGGTQKLAQSIVHDYLAFSQFDPILILNGGFGSLAANHPYQLLGLLSQVRERSDSLAKLVAPQSG